MRNNIVTNKYSINKDCKNAEESFVVLNKCLSIVKNFSDSISFKGDHFLNCNYLGDLLSEDYNNVRDACGGVIDLIVCENEEYAQELEVKFKNMPELEKLNNFCINHLAYYIIIRFSNYIKKFEARQEEIGNQMDVADKINNLLSKEEKEILKSLKDNDLDLFLKYKIK